MERPLPYSPDGSISAEVLGRQKDGTLEEWLVKNLTRIEQYPWKNSGVLPDPKKIPSLATTFEIIGLPSSGKSVGFNFLKNKLTDDVKGIFQPELSVRDTLRGRTIDRDNFRMFRIHGLEYENYKLECFKMLSFLETQRRIVEFLHKDAQARKLGDQIVAVCERGPNDVIAFSNWSIWASLGKIDGETFAETRSGMKVSKEDLWKPGVSFDTKRFVFPGLNRLVVEVWLQALTHAPLVDAVILYGTTFESNKKRRVEAGLEPEGDFVNRENWPMLERGYSWWLGSIYPLLRKRFGVGLLVVDGERPIEENNKLVLDYCRKVMDWKKLVT